MQCIATILPSPASQCPPINYTKLIAQLLRPKPRIFPWLFSFPTHILSLANSSQFNLKEREREGKSILYRLPSLSQLTPQPGNHYFFSRLQQKPPFFHSASLPLQVIKYEPDYNPLTPSHNTENKNLTMFLFLA